MDIYVYKNDEQQGPFTTSDVQAYISDGTYTPDDLAWHDGMEDWQPISTINELQPAKKSIVSQVKKTTGRKSSNTRSSFIGSMFYVQRKGNSIGPFSLVQIKGGVKAGIIKKGDKACAEGSEEWIPVKKIPGF